VFSTPPPDTIQKTGPSLCVSVLVLGVLVSVYLLCSGWGGRAEIVPWTSMNIPLLVGGMPSLISHSTLVTAIFVLTYEVQLPGA
jgi:hypothetical protein